MTVYGTNVSIGQTREQRIKLLEAQGFTRQQAEACESQDHEKDSYSVIHGVEPKTGAMVTRPKDSANNI